MVGRRCCQRCCRSSQRVLGTSCVAAIKIVFDEETCTSLTAKCNERSLLLSAKLEQRDVSQCKTRVVGFGLYVLTISKSHALASCNLSFDLVYFLVVRHSRASGTMVFRTAGLGLSASCLATWSAGNLANGNLVSWKKCSAMRVRGLQG